MQIINGETIKKYDINNPRPTPSQERLKELLDYDHLTGKLTWIGGARKDLIGKQCGKAGKTDYMRCTVDKHDYAVHRIIYKWVTGREPNIMDHKNGKPSDNRWYNLHSVTPQENNFNVGLLKNNKSGIAGVFYHEKQNRYHSNVRIGGKSHHLGSFKTKPEAEAARKAANVILGFSGRHGEAA
jgi:hypothetical protein